MSFILDLQEAIDNLQEVLTKHGHTSRLGITIQWSTQSQTGFMVRCAIIGDSLGVLNIDGNSSLVICQKLRTKLRIRARELTRAAKGLRKESVLKAASAKKVLEQLANLKLLAPPPLTELAMCAEDEDNTSEK